MTDLTQEQYEAAIPKWCGMRTIEQHMDMMLCWSLVGFAERGESKPEVSCARCPVYVAPGAAANG